jgi:hypothetical protein
MIVAFSVSGQAIRARSSGSVPTPWSNRLAFALVI